MAIAEIVSSSLVDQSGRKLVLKGDRRGAITIAFRAIPMSQLIWSSDLVKAGSMEHKLAIEIKGGTDRSNAFNRAGEAEKSHIVAKKAGYPTCWTVIATVGVDAEKLVAASPTTDEWFDAGQVLGRSGDDWLRFAGELTNIVGLSTAKQNRAASPTTRTRRSRTRGPSLE